MLCLSAMAVSAIGFLIPRAEAAPAPASTELFSGSISGQRYALTAFGRNHATGCVYLLFVLDGVGPTGCARASSASRGLASYGATCGARGAEFLWGLVPAAVSEVSANRHGEAMVRARLRALPSQTGEETAAWLLVLARPGALTSLQARDAHGMMLGSVRFSRLDQPCPAPTVSARGSTPDHLRWRLAVSAARGAGGVLNFCQSTSLAGVEGEAACLPRAALGSGRVIGRSSLQTRQPAATLLSGLVARKVSRLTITLDTHRVVVARILRFPPGARLPLNVFVVAVDGHRRALRYSAVIAARG
jgi:hypothetical protein